MGKHSGSCSNHVTLGSHVGRLGGLRRLRSPGRLVRAASASALLVLLVAAPALGMSGEGPLEATLMSESQPRGGVGPAAPEPGAALLFALGAGAVAWSTRRRATR